MTYLCRQIPKTNKETQCNAAEKKLQTESRIETNPVPNGKENVSRKLFIQILCVNTHINKQINYLKLYTDDWFELKFSFLVLNSIPF